MRRCAVITSGHLSHDHVEGVERLHGPVTIERRCADLAELVAAARAGWADAALIIGEVSALTVTLLAELRDLGLVVVAVSDVASERERLNRMGVSALPDEVEVQVLVGALQGEDLEPSGSLESHASLSSQQDVHPASRTTEAHSQTQHRQEQQRGQQEEHRAAGAEATMPPVPEELDDGEGDVLDAELADLLRTADRTGAVAEETPRTRSRKTLDAASDGGQHAGPDTERSSEDSRRPSGIVTVWGAPGSPGRTTVAVNLAAELALSGARVLLIDADTVAASVASHLGLLEESAGLAQACRQADLGRLDSARLFKAATMVELSGFRLHLLTGLPRADRWPELRERALRQVLTLAREEFDHVVVDTASPTEQDEELTFDTRAPQRNGATVCAAEEADALMAVGAADPVSFPRLVKALEDLRLNVPQAPKPRVVINQVRREVVGRAPKEQLQEAWRRFGSDAVPEVFLPWDRQICDAALLGGQVLAEVAPLSTLRRSLAELAGVDLPSRRRGLLRR